MGMAKADGKTPAGQATKKAKLLPGKKKGKKEKDTFDWRDDKRSSTESKMLPGGHKSMKSLWISRHEREQEEASNAAARSQDLPDSEQLPLTATDNRDGGAAPQSSPGDKMHASERGGDQGSHEAAVDAAADAAREQAELELRDAAETRAKQHVDDSTAREAVQPRSTNATLSPPATAAPPPHGPQAEGLGKRRPPLAEPPKKRRREVLLDVPSNTSPPTRNDQAAAQQQEQQHQRQQRLLPTPDHHSKSSQPEAQPHARSVRLAQARARAGHFAEADGHAQPKEPLHGGGALSKEARLDVRRARQAEPDSTSGAGQPSEPGASRNAEVNSPRHVHSHRRDPQDAACVPVDLMDAAGHSSALGELNLSNFESLSAVTDMVKEGWGSKLPDAMRIKLVYQDSDGDLLLMQLSEPWPDIVASALRVIVACK